MKNIFKGLGLFVFALLLVVGMGAGSAMATSTLAVGSYTETGALTITSNGAFGLVAGAYPIGIGTDATIKTISIGTGNAVQTIKIGDNATPANVITIGGAASGVTVGGTLEVGGVLTATSPVLTTPTLGVAGATKLTIGTEGSTLGALKIHTHLKAATGDQYAAEFKGEFLATSGTMDGIAAHYRMDADGTGVMRSILGVAYLGDPANSKNVTLSGTSAAGSWLSGVLGSATVESGSTVNGSAVTVTGVYGGLGSMTGSTLTAGKYMSGIWADSQATKVLSSGSNQLILATNSGSATIDSGLKILNASSGAITNDITLQNGGTINNATNGVMTLGATVVSVSNSFIIPHGAGLADAACSGLPGSIYMATSTLNDMTADVTYVCNTAGDAWIPLTGVPAA